MAHSFEDFKNAICNSKCVKNESKSKADIFFYIGVIYWNELP